MTVSASSLISHLNTANGNQASIHSKFKEWIDINFIKGITFQWSSNDIKNIFGAPLITNDAVRSNCVKYFAEKCLQIGAAASIADLCALVTTTDNEILKEEFCIVMGPITVDGDRSHLCSLFTNSIKAGNVKKIPFGTRRQEVEEDYDDNNDDCDYNQGPPNDNQGPPPNIFGMGGMGITIIIIITIIITIIIIIIIIKSR